MQAVTIHDLRTIGGGNVLAFDLIDILRLVESDVLSSSWLCRYVECMGELAEQLHAAADSGSILAGTEMLRLAGGVHQVIDGDFEACRAGETRPWLVVRAIDSTEFVVITGDERLLQFVRERFHDVRDSPDDVAHVA